MRKSTIFLLYTSVSILLFLLMFAHTFWQRKAAGEHLREKAEMVRSLGLTDLCLFTEATYTRNPSQADLHTPFQDYPMSFEHFPSGAIVAPPDTVKKLNGKLE